MDLDDYSRFSQTEKVVYDGQETFGRWSSYNFLIEKPSANEIGQITVSPVNEGRPDLISNIVYGTPLLDWVIIAFNNARDTLNWPKAGTVINYPAESIVMAEILQTDDR